MTDTAITLNGLKKLAETEKLYSSLIKKAVENLTLLSDKWHSMISTAHEVNKIIYTLKEFLKVYLSAVTFIISLNFSTVTF